MPRYSTANIEDISLLGNTVSVGQQPKDVVFSEIYKHIPSDLKLSWSNDLIFNHEKMDYEIASHLLAYVQRTFLRLITQRGSNPEDPTFGWDFEYLIDKPDYTVKQYLPIIADDVKRAVELDPDTLEVSNVTASLVAIDNQTSYIKVEVSIRPKNFEDVLGITFTIR